MITLSGTCFAEEQPLILKDAQNVLSEYQEMRYLFKNGITYKEFRERYIKLSITKERFLDKYKYSINEKDREIVDSFTRLANVYDAIEYIWQYDITSHRTDIPKSDLIWQEFEQLNSLKRDIWGCYDTKTVFQIVLDTNYAREKWLQDAISQYSEQNIDYKTKFGFTYGKVDNEGYICVTTILSEGIADKAGLKQSDKIGKINDIMVSPYSVGTYRRILATESTVKLYVKREGEPNTIIITLTY